MFRVNRIGSWQESFVSSPIVGGNLYFPTPLPSSVNFEDTKLAVWGTSGAPPRPRAERNTKMAQRKVVVTK